MTLYLLLLYVGFLLGLLFNREDGGDLFLKNTCWLGLHDVISQKIQHLMTSAVKIANPTKPSIVSTTNTRSTETKT
jgi:hypothetical protein